MTPPSLPDLDALSAALFRSSLDALVLADEEGRILGWNAAAAQTFGHTAEEAVGRTLAELIVPPSMRDAHTAAMRRYAETGVPHILDQRLQLSALHKDGHEFPVELTVTEVSLDNGRRAYAGYLRDITHSVEAEQAMERRISEQAALAELGRMSIQVDRVADLARHTVEAITSATKAAEAHYFSLGSDGDLYIIASAGQPAGSIPEATRMAERSGQPVVNRRRDGATQVDVPVVGDTATYGVLHVVHPDEPDGDGDLDFLEAAAAMLAAAADRQRTRRALQVSRDQLEVLFANVGDAITVQGSNGTITYANDAAATLMGFSSGEALVEAGASTIMDRFELRSVDGSPLDPETLPNRRVIHSKSSEEASVRYRVKATGEERWSRVRSSPVLDDSGDVALVISIIQDRTADHRREQQTTFLARLSETLGASLDADEILGRLTNSLVPHLADWAAVYVIEDDGFLAPLGIAHTDPAKLELVRTMVDTLPVQMGDGSPAATVAATGETLLIPQVDDAVIEAAVPDPALHDPVRELAIANALLIPLTTPTGSTVGVMSLANSESGRTFERSDIAFFEDIGRRAGAAVDNARLYSERTHIATTLQRTLLPPFLPPIQELEVAASYRPAAANTEVGGDFYDVFRFDEQRWAAVVGDVQGKGVEAAALVGLARHTLRGAALAQNDPGVVLNLLNRALLDHPTDRLCTAAFAVIEPGPDGTRVLVAAGGHPAPVILRRNGTPQRIDVRGDVLGAFGTGTWTTASATLLPGDLFLLYSDGAAPRNALLPEAIERLVEGMQTTQSVGAFTAQLEFRMSAAQPEGFHDDMTLLVVRVP